MIRKLVVFISIFILSSIAFLPNSVAAATTIIQPSSYDTTLNALSPDNNHGGLDYVVVRGHLDPYRVLEQFDLSVIPAGSVVSSATLKLYDYMWLSYNPVGRTYWAYRVTQSWTEGGATWNKYDGVNSWATPGGDYTATGGASATVPSIPDWMSWTVTDIVKAWIEDGEPNYGFLIKDSSESGSLAYYSYFYSREEGDPNTALRPILEITYRLPISAPELSLPLVVVVSTAAIIFFLYKRRLSPTLTH